MRLALTRFQWFSGPNGQVDGSVLRWLNGPSGQVDGSVFQGSLWRQVGVSVVRGDEEALAAKLDR
jgi:hypothetical protein